VRWWKVLGVAAFAGVAAGGVLIARDERRRRSYEPEEVRARLHERLARAAESRVKSGPGDTKDGEDRPDARVPFGL
jgi:hypothetical protein